MVTVQNLYNLANRQDDVLLERTAAENIAFVPYFPLGGFIPLQSGTLTEVASRLDASPQQVAPAWLPRRSPNWTASGGRADRRRSSTVAWR